METMFGSPWDFGTGVMAPFSQNSQSFQPVMPQVDLAGEMAQMMAARGIRPDQFFSNPNLAVEAIKPPPVAPIANEWDATPVSMPGGPAVSLPGAANVPNPNTQVPLSDEASAASATSAGGEMKAAKEKTTAEKFSEGLRGVKAPAAPALQSVRTPSGVEPKAGAIKGGELLAMLLAMQGGGGQPGLKLPPTLGASLKGVY